jgi:hypothetical protein
MVKDKKKIGVSFQVFHHLLEERFNIIGFTKTKQKNIYIHYCFSLALTGDFNE